MSKQIVCDYCDKIIKDVHYVKVGFTYFNEGAMHDFCDLECAVKFGQHNFTSKKDLKNKT